MQKGYLPQLSIQAQATYQSEVTKVPLQIPGVDMPSLSKDQYKAYAEVNQLLYDGGSISTRKQQEQSDAAIQEQQVKADLYQLRERINQLFFGVLLIDEQLKQTNLLIGDLELGYHKVAASVQHGTAFRSNAAAIRAEILSARQHITELQAGRKAYTDMLAVFTGMPVTENTVLIKPLPVMPSMEIRRPELLLFEAQVKGLDVQKRSLQATTPRVGLFVQGGYGRPALDMLNNDFRAYYIGGIRLSWSPSAFYTLKNKKAQIDIGKAEVATQRETFLFNTDIALRQQNAEIGKYVQLMATDSQIIALRNQVKEAALAQLENGVITGNDFLKEVNSENQARQNKILHEIQLLMAQYNRQTTTGNE